MRCELRKAAREGVFPRLNPCFSGICAARPIYVEDEKTYRLGLNPCFSGICAARITAADIAALRIGLNPCFSGICAARFCRKSKKI